jgi:glutamate-1-semialdehyde aminotransferase
VAGGSAEGTTTAPIGAREAMASPGTLASAAPASAGTEVDRFGAFAVKLGTDERAQDPAKLEFVRDLAAAANNRAPLSKRMAQQYRGVLADNRVSAGFRPLLKELVYPTVAEIARGAQITDVDGNSYVDFTMGFGAHFFGHSPPFVVEAIQRQLATGIPIGPQSPIAGRVAELIAALTGHERVTFCNSGTEATMTAVRIARAKTGRRKIVLFRNSYHGTFDGFLARSSGVASRPASLGTPDSLVADTVVLDYCAESALDYVSRYGSEIAAILVEPVQSRALGLRPMEFLRQLRRHATDAGAALVFDEVITGFRCAPGGAQQVFEVRADICTYGKVLGGGMPIGVVAGSAAYMDAVDGGPWQFGDASSPAHPTIFFAGTFSKHPLTMAASLAVLEHIKAAGDALYLAVNERTDRLCRRLNDVFEDEGVDVKVDWFSSLFRFASSGNLDVFYSCLLQRGFFIWEGRNCFLSTEHSEADLTRFVEAVRATCVELRGCGLLPARQAEDGRRRADPMPIALSQRRFVVLCQTEEDRPSACNLCFGLQFEPPVDVDRLTQAVASVLAAEDTLWHRFDFERGTQHAVSLAERRVDIERIATPRGAEETGAIDDLMAAEQRAPLDPAAARNARARVFTREDGTAVLSLCVHHLVCDGWGLGILFERIAALYPENAAAAHAARTEHVPYARWLEAEEAYERGPRRQRDAQFWQGVIHRIASYQRGHAYGPRRHSNAVRARPGARARLALDERATSALKARARADAVTPFVVLLSAFQVFLNRVYPLRLPIIGVPFANRGTREEKQTVGTCVNLLPFLSLHERDTTVEATLKYTKEAIRDLFAHSLFPYDAICEMYRAATSTPDVAPVEITFNVEPFANVPDFDGRRPALLAGRNDRIEFDLMFNVFLFEDSMRIELDYDRELLAEGAAYGLMNLYAKIVENYCSRVEPSRAPLALDRHGAA